VVTDILTISSIDTKQEKVNISKVCVNSVISELLATFKTRVTNQNITLHAKYQLTDNQSEILTDKAKLTQILANLIANAIKFTYEGSIEFGYSLIETCQEVPPNKDIPLLEFYVKDTGIGINKDLHEKIFERFRQADLSINKTYGGTGLGLSISKGFIDLLGGKIWVDSAPGKGSTFYFTIAYNPTNEILETTVMKEPGTNYRKKSTILVAEDETYNFLYIEELLIDQNYTLIHAKNGLEAVRLFKENPDIALVLMDIKMPQMDGATATKIIKGINPIIPVIAQTAYALEQEKREFLKSGFDEYLVKPIKESVLMEILHKYLSRT
jgi:CheY-like chemotaxis protein